MIWIAKALFQHTNGRTRIKPALISIEDMAMGKCQKLSRRTVVALQRRTQSSTCESHPSFWAHGTRIQTFSWIACYKGILLDARRGRWELQEQVQMLPKHKWCRYNFRTCHLCWDRLCVSSCKFQLRTIPCRVQGRAPKWLSKIRTFPRWK